MQSMRRACESFLRGETTGPFWALLRWPLIPLGLCFGELAAFRLWLYQRGHLNSEDPGIRVISVGNLVTGGTGKTPFVRLLAEMLLAMRERPLILGRGYGARDETGSLDEEGRSFQRDLPGVPVLQNGDRLGELRRYLESSEAPTVILLDDGAQHRKIRRDVEIILVDATCPFGSGWPIPAGSLREFPGALRRSDLVVVTRSDEVDPVELHALVSRIERMTAHGPVILARHVAARLMPGSESPNHLEGRDVFLASGIAHPASFRKLVRSIGAGIAGHAEYPDHHDFRPEDLVRIEQAARASQAEMIVATGKDEPKIAPRVGDGELPWRFLEVDIDLVADGAATLERIVAEGESRGPASHQVS